jgi:hypothetical protein
MTNATRSQVFSRYNTAKGMARDGLLDEARVNRALGVAQKSGESKYHTTADYCDCPDSKYRGVVCKHRIAAALVA